MFTRPYEGRIFREKTGLSGTDEEVRRGREKSVSGTSTTQVNVRDSRDKRELE